MSITLTAGKDCKVTTKELNLKYQNFRSSSHSDSVEIGENERIKIELLYAIKNEIARVLSVHFKTEITVKFGSGARTKKTHQAIYDALNRNRKVKLTAPEHSQHLYFEAGDLHFYQDRERMKREYVLKEYFTIIDDKLGWIIQQMLRYSWGIHIGVVTERREYRRFRKN